MKILMLKTGKQYEVLREKADYYIYGENGERIYKKVEGEDFIIVGKNYSWGTVYPQTAQEAHSGKSSAFPPVVVKINYEDSEELNERLKKYGHS